LHVLENAHLGSTHAIKDGGPPNNFPQKGQKLAQNVAYEPQDQDQDIYVLLSNAA